MKKSNLIVYFSLIILSSCSSTPTYTERIPASVFNSCKSAISSFLGSKAPKTPEAQIGGKVTSNVDRSYVIKNHTNSTFTTGRNLDHYMLAFSRPGHPMLSLAKDLEKIKMNPNAHWLDAGGGMGFATEEATKAGGSKFTSTLVSVETGAEDIIDAQTNVVRRKVIKGQFIEDIADEAMPKSDVITDMYGPMAYSSRLDQVLRKYIDNLKKDGVAYIYLGEALDKFGENNLIVTGAGKLLTLTEWMESIPGLKVEIARVESLFPDSNIFEGEKSRVAKISLSKPSSEIEIPELELLSFKEGGAMDGYIVPRMIFKETKFVKHAEYPTNSAVNNSLKNLIINFRTGEFEHSVLDNLNSIKGSKWAHFSNQEINWGELPDIKIKDDNYFDISTERLLSRLKDAAAKNVRPQIVSPKNLTGQQDTMLISDHNGGFLSFDTPDKALQLYLDSLAADGKIILHLGDDKHGMGQVKILTGDGSYMTLKQWLSRVPGLSVTFKHTAEYKTVPRKRLKASASQINLNILGPTEDYMSRENSFGQVAVISIKDREKINIPELKYLGKTKTNADGYELPLYSQ